MRNCPHTRFNFKSAEFSRKNIWEQKRSGGGEKEGGKNEDFCILATYVLTQPALGSDQQERKYTPALDS